MNNSQFKHRVSDSRRYDQINPTQLGSMRCRPNADKQME